MNSLVKSCMMLASMGLSASALAKSDVVQSQPAAAKAGAPAAKPASGGGEAVALGKEKYQQICQSCHTPTGVGMGTMYPDIRGRSAAYVVEKVNIALGKDPKAKFITDPNKTNMMKAMLEAFKLTDEQIKAVATYVEKELHK